MIEDISGTLNVADDILAFAETMVELDRVVRKLLQVLQDNGFTVSAEKCEFMKERIVKKAKAPATVGELNSILGLALFCMRFIKDFSSITAPLWALTRKKVKWEWTEECQKAFEMLKLAVIQRAVGYFDKRWTTRLVVDASPVGLGAVLVQMNDVATHCKYDNVDNEILKHMVANCGMSQFQAKCIKEDNLDLSKALVIARGYERDVKQLNVLSQQRYSINYASNPPKHPINPLKQNSECNGCGQASHQEKQDCRAYGRKCYNCDEYNHFANVCPQKDKRGNNGNNNRQQTTRNHPYPKETQSNRSLNMMKNGADMSISVVEPYIFNVQETTERLPRCTLAVNEELVSGIIDSGASVNIMPWSVYSQLTKQPELKPCSTKLFSYGQKDEMDLIGQFIAKVRSTTNCIEETFVVTRCGQECLWSKSTSVKLGLITFSNVNHTSQLNESDRAKNQYKEEFVELFENRLGKMRNKKIRLDINKQIKPVK